MTQLVTDTEDSLDGLLALDGPIVVNDNQFSDASTLYSQIKSKDNLYPTFDELPSFKSDESGIDFDVQSPEKFTLCTDSESVIAPSDFVQKNYSKNTILYSNSTLIPTRNISVHPDNMLLPTNELSYIRKSCLNPSEYPRNVQYVSRYNTTTSRSYKPTYETSFRSHEIQFTSTPLNMLNPNVIQPNDCSDSGMDSYDEYQQYISCSNTFQSQSSQNSPQDASTQSESDPEVTLNISKNPSQICSSLLNLYNDECKNFSDFSYVYLLSAKICQTIVPAHCFPNLKMALLLSITSITKNTEVPPLPIVAMGIETATINLVMNHIGNAAARFLTPADNFKSEGILMNENMIEAGPMLLANGGVYFIGDWSLMKPKVKSTILNEVECGKVRIEKSSIMCPLKCAVWSYTSFYKFNQKDLHTMRTFMEVFGIPIIVEDTSGEEYVDFLLNSLNEPTHMDNQMDDIRDFLVNLSAKSVEFTTEAHNLLEKYFVSCRKEQPDSISRRGIVILKQMAESFAKISFRNEVIPADVIAAIYFNEDLKQKVGMQVDRSPTLSVSDGTEEVDEFFKNFGSWLNEFLSKF